MKKIILPCLAVLLILASCKKTDIENPETQSSETSASVAANLSGWKTIGNWTAANNNYEASISDQKITSDIAGEGLVLLYAKGKAIQLLPGQVEKTYFYYQVEDGSIQINASTDFNKSLEFSYIIFSKEQLSSMEQKGINKSQLMKMSYQQVSQLKD